MNDITKQSVLKMIGLWVILTLSMVLSLNAAVIKIMPLGDSITEGISEIPDTPENNLSTYTSGLTQSADKIGYRGKLWDLLKADGTTNNYTVDFVGSRSDGSAYLTAGFDTNHEGYGGTTSAFIKDNITNYMASNPDIVLLHIGTNDPTAGGITIANSVSNISETLTTIFTENPNAKVFVARIIENPRAEAQRIGIYTTTDYNNQVESMVNAHANTANIFMVDMQSTLSYAPAAGGLNDMQPYHSDETVIADVNLSDYHPTVHGYAKMGQKWFSALQSAGVLTGTPIIPGTATLVNQWHLDETSGTSYADNIGGKNLSSNGGFYPTATVGKINGAQDFDGSQVIAIGGMPEYNATQSYSIACWIKPSATTATEVFVSHTNTWIGRAGATLKVELSAGKQIANVGTLNIDAWNHVAVVKEGNATARVYVNGAESYNGASTGDGTPVVSTMGPEVRLGANGSSASFGYDGILDEVSISAGELTAAQVQALYAAGGGDTNNTETNTTDTTPPVITLTGAAVISLEVNATYTEAGATVTDNNASDTNITVIIGGSEVNTSKAGTYTVTYDANDSAGNQAVQVTRTVIVTPATVVINTVPTITLIGSPTVTHPINTPYSDAGASANDVEDGDITADIVSTGIVDVNTTGTYILNYDVNDSNGTAAIRVTRTVTIEAASNTAPSITLIGDSTVTIIVGTAYSDAGATAEDTEDGDDITTAKIVTTSDVDSNTVGSYTVTYNVSDSQGLAAGEVTRTVIVAAVTDKNKAPSITLTGKTTVDLIVGTPYVDAGATATDPEDGDITANIVKTGTVDSNTTGTYTLNYDVNDSNATAAGTVHRTVIVRAATTAGVDANNDGIPDHYEGVYSYNKEAQLATATANGKVSTLEAINAMVVVQQSFEGSTLILRENSTNAYMKLKINAQVQTGFASDSTLKTGTFFNAGSRSVMKKDAQGKVTIETITTLVKDESIIIGGK